ncbi:Hsp20/alpha crystallin family protein [Candidatus Woesearchaeota archaeon]|nr:Hsp20/alpha crystallin family protein [Candidatus Woesearchaeota archaeon]
MVWRRRRTPFDDIFDMWDRFMDSFWRDFETPLSQGFREPETEMVETDNEIIVTMELPGVNKEDIDLKVTEDLITVKVEEKQEVKTETSFRKSYKGFYKSLKLPVKVDPNETKASYKNGILEVRLKKAEKTGRKVKIE